MSAVPTRRGERATASFPGAQQPVKPAPRPIQFPSRAHVEELCRTRANGDNERWRHQAEQRALLIAAARADGYAEGERTGYTQGWHWGLACGACAGAVAVGLAWLASGRLTAWLAAWGAA